MVLDRSILELWGEVYGIRSVYTGTVRGGLWYYIGLYWSCEGEVYGIISVYTGAVRGGLWY